ncbi:Ger(x)C family spore germination protein [Clostridium estertheticum]|uniref:Ger(x)C family spore germination protein n=1 Tax=Clostridium estertheticum TaxID=238834 RepID=UPI001C6F2D1B|nr:Ger(x)C family spore germination protein [Clostridium estertheticum]MBW9170249.1 Ger(x)C family spore germination protein [Clostridium estertheticum]WLC75411.1 Ger(x)C family spore germination protein [Clostridium estertheticum]
MSKYKKTLVIICLIISCFNMSACFSYRDINRLLFVTCIIIDVDSNGNPIIYSEAYKGIRGGTPQGTDERILFEGKGKTIFEAVRNMNSTSSYKLNYTQNKAIIFTQNAAESGLENYIDFLDRDQELLIRPYIAIYLGDPEKLIKMNILQEKYIGFFIMHLVENVGSSSRALKLSLNDFYNQRNMGDKTNVVTIIDFPKDALEQRLEINGGAVIKDDKMVSIIKADEGQGFNFLMNAVSSGSLEITNPCDINKFITLEILKSKTKTEINYDGNVIHMKKRIKVNVDFAEAQKKIVFTKENVNKIVEKSEKNIVESCNSLFAKYKTMGIDIFDITEQFYDKYPKIKIPNNIIKKTELKVEVEVQIMNTGDQKNFQ